MSTNTKIEWADKTWSPVIGCSKVSEGCRNCYAIRMSHRLSNNPGTPQYRGLTHIRGGKPEWTNQVRLLEERLLDPFKWRKPARVFVNSMSDLFHEDVPFEFIDKVFAVMALCPQHTFQCLSKRPENMVRYFKSKPLDRIVALIQYAMHEQGTGADFEWAIRDRLRRLDLEDRKAPWSRSEAGWGVLLGRNFKPVCAGSGGVSGAGRLPSGGSNDQREAGGDGGTPDGLDSPQQSHSGWPHDQSQERGKGRQSAGESRSGDVQGTTPPCDPNIGGEASRRTRIEAPKDTSVRSGRSGNASAEAQRRDGEGHRSTVRDDEESNVGDHLSSDVAAHLIWPLPNVWLGTSVENQETANKRIPYLVECPAAVSFLSCEPLLESVDLSDLWNVFTVRGGHRILEQGIHWVIVGGESGPGARPMNPQWARSLRDQCVSAGVPFFFKQCGEWVDEFHPQVNLEKHKANSDFVEICDGGSDYKGFYMFRVGKKAAGRLLDGRTWDEYPETFNHIADAGEMVDRKATIKDHLQVEEEGE